MSVLRLGLIGHPLGHSWSQRWFIDMFRREGIADASYSLFPLPSLDGLREWVLREGLAGFNVTIPYKEAVISFLDALDPEARRIGAVNCVQVEGDRLTGHNTDAPAFRDTLLPHLKPWQTEALVLGTGGAAKAVCHVLRQLGITPVAVSRTPEKHPGAISYSEAANLMKSHLLVVNTTPVGMYPQTESTPWTHPELWTAKHLAYDLVYNPSPTRFLREASTQGAETLHGLAMLHRQAELSWTIWSSRGIAARRLP